MYWLEILTSIKQSTDMNSEMVRAIEKNTDFLVMHAENSMNETTVFAV